MKQKEIFLIILSAFCLFGQSVYAKIKVPVTFLIQTNVNNFNSATGQFILDSAIYTNCNLTDCNELSAVYLKVDSLYPKLDSSTDSIYLNLTGKAGHIPLTENFVQIQSFQKNSVYKSLPWSHKLNIEGKLDLQELQDGLNYFGNSVLHIIVL